MKSARVKNLVSSISAACFPVFLSCAAFALSVSQEEPIKPDHEAKVFFTSTFSLILFIILFVLTFFMIRYITQIRSAATSAGGTDVEIDQAIHTHVKDPMVARTLSRTFQTTLDKRLKEATIEYQTNLDEKDKEVKKINTQYKKTLVEKRQTENVVHSLSDGLIVLNTNGEVVMMNPAAEKLLDVNKEQQFGKPIKNALKKEQMLSLAQEKQGKEFKEIELSAENDDTRKVIRASSAVIEDENGQTIGMVSMLTDITKQKELDRLKDKFVTTVSHELRTPLIAVRNALAVILNRSAGPMSDLQEKFLVIAQRNIDRLGLLINDLLDISKLESGKTELHPESVSIDKLISETIETMTHWAKAKNISLVKDVDAGLPDILIDPHRITQVFTNLIGNSIKFTPANGKITLGARTDPDKTAILISVRDTGIGIAKEDMQKVFEKFYQANTAWQSSNAISGTGLGLSICKELVQLHGGRIWIESEVGKGTTFFFTLPMPKPR